MRKLMILTASTAALALSACAQEDTSGAETATEVQAQEAEMEADRLDEAADNATTEVGEEMMEDKA